MLHSWRSVAKPAEREGRRRGRRHGPQHRVAGGDGVGGVQRAVREAEESGGAVRVDGQVGAGHRARAEGAPVEVVEDVPEGVDVPVEGGGDAGQVVAVADGHRGLEVGVDGHDDGAVGAGPGEQHRLEPQHLAEEVGEFGAEPERGDGGLDVVAGAAGVELSADLRAEFGDQMALVHEVEAARGRQVVEGAEAVGPQRGDAAQQGGGRLAGQQTAFGEHHHVGQVDGGGGAEFLADVLGAGLAVDDPPGAGSEGAGQASGAAHERARSGSALSVRGTAPDTSS